MAEIDWNAEWESSWKARARNVWFQYQADVYADWLGRDALRDPGRTLKTDAFDEACGYGPLAGMFSGSGSVHMDISRRILAEASRTTPGVRLGCVTDVRRLAFQPGSFDLVFSPSTLDHFGEEDDLVAGLRELRGVLRAGGRLLVTLDNPANPLLAARRVVHRLLGPVGGLIPFPMGRTLSRRRLVAALEQAGFEVLRSGTLVHAPRILGLWLGEWAARRGHSRLGHWLRGAFASIERLAGALPSRGFTGHFVAADCRSLGPLPPQAEQAAPAAARGLTRVVAAFRGIEDASRCAYLCVLPRAVVARVDPTMRAAAKTARRAAAVPVYLRQRLSVWEGWCDGEPAGVAVWGRCLPPQRFLEQIFDGVPSVTWHGSCSLSSLRERGPELASAADLLVAETTPFLAPALRRQGFLITPNTVRFAADPAALLATQARPNRSLASDLARLRRSGYRVEIWSHSRARSLLFYHRYMIPHAATRFEDGAGIPYFASVDRHFALGCALAAFAPDATEPDAIGVGVQRGDTLWWPRLGTRDGDPELLQRGALGALYQAMTRVAAERNSRVMDVGRSPAWRRSGTAWYKLKWGFQPIVCTTQTLEYAVKVLRPGGAVARRLVERGLFVREGERVSVITPEAIAGTR